MIRRLYVDNFRSLVDFTWEPGKECLVLGYNGSGKTSALDALDIVRIWIGGYEPIVDILKARDRSRWKGAENVRFGIDVETPGGLLRYRSEFAFHSSGNDPYVVAESLWAEEGSVFVREREEVTYNWEDGEPTSTIPIPLVQSASSFLQAVNVSVTEPVRRFVAAITSMIVVRPFPPAMEAFAAKTEKRPRPFFENFVAWYWENSTNGSYQRAMAGLLDEVWVEFDYLRLEQVGRDTKGLNAVFKGAKTTEQGFSLDFDELSEGERMLIVLYSLLAYQKSQPPTTIIIDEPDNFVSLLEIQPWLLTMLDTCPEGGQLILISHNSEIIQTFGYEQVAYFTRKDHASPTRVRKIEPDGPSFSLDKWLRRGWLDE